mmetsp:Transcript_872/g.968  ORF Transcript_872/g.968 Transcript_872/m.968 type:complete len:122 (-) Transcript_872:155-520(-)
MQSPKPAQPGSSPLVEVPRIIDYKKLSIGKPNIILHHGLLHSPALQPIFFEFPSLEHMVHHRKLHDVTNNQTQHYLDRNPYRILCTSLSFSAGLKLLYYTICISPVSSLSENISCGTDFCS